MKVFAVPLAIIIVILQTINLHICYQMTLFEIPSKQLLKFIFKCTTHVMDSISLHVLLHVSDSFSNIFSELPSVFHAQFEIVESKHEVQHYINTSGQSVFIKARIHSGKLQADKKEYRHMVSLGIVRTWNSSMGFSPCIWSR